MRMDQCHNRRCQKPLRPGMHVWAVDIWWFCQECVKPVQIPWEPSRVMTRAIPTPRDSAHETMYNDS